MEFGIAGRGGQRFRFDCGEGDSMMRSCVFLRWKRSAARTPRPRLHFGKGLVLNCRTVHALREAGQQ